MGKFIDITGMHFGRLSVIKKLKQRSNNKEIMWLCQCSCGKSKSTTGSRLKNKQTSSCGCLHKEQLARRNKKNAIHGLTGTSMRNTWGGMISRCYNKNNPSFEHYGPKGRDVCPRWRGKQGFINFLNDMGPKPSPQHSLDRIDNNKGYSPENCRWADIFQQNNNKINNIYLEKNGLKLNLKEWSEKTGIKKVTIQSRIKKGWDVDKILSSADYRKISRCL